MDTYFVAIVLCNPDPAECRARHVKNGVYVCVYVCMPVVLIDSSELCFSRFAG